MVERRGGRAAPAAIVLLLRRSVDSRAGAAAAGRRRGTPPDPDLHGGARNGRGTIEVDTPSGTRRRAVPPDRDTLRRLAASSGGRYFEADDQPELSEVYERLGSQVGKRDEQREITAAFAGGGRPR